MTSSGRNCSRAKKPIHSKKESNERSLSGLVTCLTSTRCAIGVVFATGLAGMDDVPLSWNPADFV